jgi:hypothetical protein
MAGYPCHPQGHQGTEKDDQTSTSSGHRHPTIRIWRGPDCQSLRNLQHHLESKENKDEDSTNSTSDGEDSSSLPIDPSTGPPEGAQFIDNTTLTQPSESPISQVPSLASNLAVTILSESAVLEHEQLVSLSPNAVDTLMAVDSNNPALSSNEDRTIPYHNEPLPDVFRWTTIQYIWIVKKGFHCRLKSKGEGVVIRGKALSFVYIYLIYITIASDWSFIRISLM